MVRLIGKVLMVVVVLTGLGYWPCRHWWGQAGIHSLLLAAVIAFLTAWAGLIPPLLARKKGLQPFVTACLMGTTIRFLIVLLLGGIGYGLFHPVKWAFGLCLGLFYAALLILDIFQLLQYLKTINAEGQPDGTSVSEQVNMS